MVSNAPEIHLIRFRRCQQHPSQFTDLSAMFHKSFHEIKGEDGAIRHDVCDTLTRTTNQQRHPKIRPH